MEPLARSLSFATEWFEPSIAGRNTSARRSGNRRQSNGLEAFMTKALGKQNEIIFPKATYVMDHNF